MPDHPHPENDELELEPVDPEILSHQRQRAKQKTDHAQAAVDADLIRQAEELSDPISLEDLKKFRFTTRHLMILTALLALIMAFCQLWGLGLALFIFAVAAVSAGWFFTMRYERRQHEAVDRLRHELAVQQETRQHGNHGSATTEDRSASNDDRPEPVVLPMPPADLNFSFSLKEILLAFTAAAVLLGLVGLFGTRPLAILLSIIALGGLGSQVARWETPPILVFGWWILLLLYLLLGLWSYTSAEEGTIGSRQGAVIIQTARGDCRLPENQIEQTVS